MSAASADDQQGKALATTGASVSAFLIATSQFADGTLCADGLVCQMELISASGTCHLQKKFTSVTGNFFFENR